MKSSLQTAYCFICSLVTLERTIHLSSYDLKFPSKSVSSFLHEVNSIESSRYFSGSFCLLNHTLVKTLALKRHLVLLLVVLTNSSSSSFCSSSIKNLFMFSVRISTVTDARGKFEEHERCVRFARGDGRVQL